VYQVALTPATVASSSRRRPAVRRRPPAARPTDAGAIALRHQEVAQLATARIVCPRIVCRSHVLKRVVTPPA
jgi:hypothetical protein